MIRFTGILIVGLLVVSCRTTKTNTAEQPKAEPVKETHHTTEPATETYTLGEVQLLDCGAVIQFTSGEKKVVCAPTNLDPKFQVDKLRLKLKFKVLEQKATICSEFPAIEIEEAFAVR